MNKYIKINTSDLTIFLSYLLDKIDKCYYNEVRKSIKRFLKENNIESDEV